MIIAAPPIDPLVTESMAGASVAVRCDAAIARAQPVVMANRVKAVPTAEPGGQGSRSRRCGAGRCAAGAAPSLPGTLLMPMAAGEPRISVCPW